jgi:hypothetical protein
MSTDKTIGEVITEFSYSKIRGPMVNMFNDYSQDIDLDGKDVSFKQGKVDDEKMSRDKHCFFLSNLQSYNVFGSEGAKILLDNVELREHDGDKRVFAKRDLKDGDIITLIPADIVGFNRGEACYTYYSDFLSDYKFESEEARKEHFESMIRTAMIPLSEEKQIFSSALNCENPAFLGHFVTDGATDFRDKRNYLTSSLKARNADIKTENGDLPFVPIVASKDITAGSEIFISNGVRYWFGEKINPRNVKYIVLENERANLICESFSQDPSIQTFKNSDKQKLFIALSYGERIISSLFLIEKESGHVPSSVRAIYSNDQIHTDSDKVTYCPIFGNRSSDVSDDMYTVFLANISKDNKVHFYSTDEEIVDFYIKAGFTQSLI